MVYKIYACGKWEHINAKGSTWDEQVHDAFEKKQRDSWDFNRAIEYASKNRWVSKCDVIMQNGSELANIDFQPIIVFDFSRILLF